MSFWRDNILSNKTDIARRDYQLPSDFTINNLDVYIPDHLNLIHNFLSKNYITSANNDVTLSYPKPVLIWLLRQTTPDLCLGFFYKNMIIGFICAVPVSIVVDNNEQQLFHIDLFCVHTKMRKKGIGRYLLFEIENRIVQGGCDKAIFTSQTDMGNAVSTTCLAGILLKTDNPELQKIIPPDSKLTGMRHLSSRDVSEVNKRLQAYMSKYKLYQKFTDQEFLRNFRSVRDGIYSYVLWNKSEPVGFISFICVNYNMGTTIKRLAHIYYYYGNINDLILAAVSHLRKRNISELRFYLMMDNHEIDIPSIIMRESPLYHYAYNLDCPKLKNSEVAFLPI